MKKLVAGILCGALLFLGGCAAVDKRPYAETIVSSEASAPQEFSSQSSVPSSSDTVSVIPLPPAPAMEEGWWKKALAQSTLRDESNPIQRCYVYQNADSYSAKSYDFTDEPEDQTDYSLILSTAVEAEDIGPLLQEPSFFEIVMRDGTSYKGTFHEKGIALAPTLTGRQEGQTVQLAIRSEDYAQILNNIRNTLSAKRILLPAWLTNLQEILCTSIALTTVGGEKQTVYTPDELLFSTIFSSLKDINIEPNTIKKVDKSTILEDAVKIDCKFSDGSFCNIQCNGGKLIVALPRKDYVLQYTINSDLKNALNDMAKGEFNPETGKPVLYLYPEKPTDVTVKVDYKGEFSYTYPAYNGGWQVTAYPDGRLVNKADGGEYYYLFWEGNAGARWRFDEGFVVKGSETERFLRGALSTLGLTAREYNDFIVYWLPQMQHNPYNLITFATDEYEALAPLTVTPAPDSILRVHMVYKPLEKAIELPAQKLTPFERKGFTVVEWGGSHAR